MTIEFILGFLCGAFFVEMVVLGVFLYEDHKILQKLLEIKKRQPAGEWIPADWC